MFKSLALILTLVATVRGGKVCCKITGCHTDDKVFKHLPLPQCENVVDPQMLLFDGKSDLPTYLILDELSHQLNKISSKKKLVVIIHGYMNDERSHWMNFMKDMLLFNEDMNVVVVGWGGGSKSVYYPQSASNTRVVGAMVAKLIDGMVKKGQSRSLVHCVGHSLGAHTCGHVGSNTKIGRITGLDPAGPMFGDYHVDARLSPDDAQYVDVIHTAGRETSILDYGTMTPMGHADFYPNGGGTQPGCGSFNYPVPYGDIAGCSHSRAVAYFTESIVAPCYTVTMKCKDIKKLPGSCSSCGSKCQNMGYASNKYKARGLFYVQTNKAIPYCKGKI